MQAKAGVIRQCGYFGGGGGCREWEGTGPFLPELGFRIGIRNSFCRTYGIRVQSRLRKVGNYYMLVTLDAGWLAFVYVHGCYARVS